MKSISNNKIKIYKFIIVIYTIILLVSCTGNFYNIQEGKLNNSIEEIVINDEIKLKFIEKQFKIDNIEFNLEIPNIDAIYFDGDINEYINQYFKDILKLDCSSLNNNNLVEENKKIEITNYEVYFDNKNILSLNFLINENDNIFSKGFTFDLKYNRILNLFNIISVEDLKDILKNNKFEIIQFGKNNDINNYINKYIINDYHILNDLKYNFFIKQDGLYIILEDFILKIFNNEEVEKSINNMYNTYEKFFQDKFFISYFNEESYLITNNILLQKINYSINNNNIEINLPMLINDEHNINFLIRKEIYNIIDFDFIENELKYSKSNMIIKDFNLILNNNNFIIFTFSCLDAVTGTASPNVLFYQIDIDLKNNKVNVNELGEYSHLSEEDIKNVGL